MGMNAFVFAVVVAALYLTVTKIKSALSLRKFKKTEKWQKFITEDSPTYQTKAIAAYEHHRRQAIEDNKRFRQFYKYGDTLRNLSIKLSTFHHLAKVMLDRAKDIVGCEQYMAHYYENLHLIQSLDKEHIDGLLAEAMREESAREARRKSGSSDFIACADGSPCTCC